LAIALQNDPTSTAYVIVYPGQQANLAKFSSKATRVLIIYQTRGGIDKGRIVVIIGHHVAS